MISDKDADFFSIFNVSVSKTSERSQQQCSSLAPSSIVCDAIDVGCDDNLERFLNSRLVLWPGYSAVTDDDSRPKSSQN